MFEESSNRDASIAPDGVTRRVILKLGAVGTAGVALTAAGEAGAPYLSHQGMLSADGPFAATANALGDLLFYKEVYPTSPLILNPFHDELRNPRALAPVSASTFSRWPLPPGPGPGQQSSLRNERHQIWPDQIGFPDPIVYKIDLLVRTHAFTTSPVLPIDPDGRPTVSFDSTGRRVAAGTERTLPPSMIYGFNGTSPGHGSTPSTASRSWSASRTIWTRTRSGSTGRTSAHPTGRSSPTCTTGTPRPRATAIRTTR